MTKLNMKLLSLLSPKWAATFKRGLTYKDYRASIYEPEHCVVGCFYNYSDHYMNAPLNNEARTHSHCQVCTELAKNGDDIAKGVGYILEQNRNRCGPVRWTKNDTPIMPRGAKWLDKEATEQLNAMLEHFYNHVKEAHPQLLIEKMEKVILK